MELEAEQFCQACIMGDLARVERLLAADPTLANARGSVRPDHQEFMRAKGSDGGWTALHLAAHYGQFGVVKALVRAGADVNKLSENREGNTPLMAAVAGGSLPVVSFLLESGADPKRFDAGGKFNALALAGVDRKPEIVALFAKL